MSDSFVNVTPTEAGVAPPKAPPVGELPPNNALWNIPHFETFAAIANFASRTYRWSFDEALRDNTQTALAMRRDPIIDSALNDRIIPTCQLDWTIEAMDESDPSQAKAAQKIKQIIQRIPGFQGFQWALLQGLFFGRYGVQYILEWDWSTGERQMVINRWKPIHGDKFVFKFDDTPGLLVNPAYYTGTMEPTDRGMAHFFTPAEQEQLVIFKFMVEDSDFFEQQLAGRVHGVGFRDRLYWFFWLRNNLTTILMDYLQKVGAGGFTVFYYEAGNEQSMREVRNAALNQLGNTAYLFPRNRDGQSAYNGPGIDVKQISMSGAEIFIQLWNMLNGILRGYIMGETLTTNTAATGLGSGVAQAHESTAERRTKFDATTLDECLNPMVKALYKYNCPGIPPGRFKHAVDKPNVAEFLGAANAFYELGGSLDEDDAREKLGLPKPEPGHAILSKAGAMQPAAVGAVPQGVPMAAPEVPAGGQGQMPTQGQPVPADDQQQQGPPPQQA